MEDMNTRTNPKNGDRLSQLAFGCMRFQGDFDETRRQVLHAIEQGVNYFDTAYIYPNNESTLGRALEGGYRERVKIATKMPPYLVKKYADFDRIFDAQLARLKTDYIDYYLLHMLTDVNALERLRALGFEKWLGEKKASGQIRNIGFSYHGGRSEFPKLIDAFDWDFCMIQFNYLDEHTQAGREGLEYAASKGLPVMIMEPLRGGRLADKLPPEVRSLFRAANPDRSPAEWAFRWVYNFPGVTTVLSGMNSMAMIEENLRVASDALPNSFTEDELRLFESVREKLLALQLVPCTGCNYCMPCPAGVDIPTCFSCLNSRATSGRFRAFTNYLMQTSMKRESGSASKCVGCGKCEAHCPQKIEIRKELKGVVEALEPFYYRPARAVIKRMMRL
jgi:predicted aldo/keto reductase-like oxidoreductase